MSDRAQAIIERAKNVRNVAVEGRLVKKATRFMTLQEKESKQEALSEAEENLSPSNIAASSLTTEGRKNMARYRSYLKQNLAENVAPVDLSVEERNATLAEERRLAEHIKEGMLPTEVMRRNPAGAVGHHMRWEKMKKDMILAWKNFRRMNNPDDDSEDLANVEMLRPSLAGKGTAATFMADAQIPGYIAFSNVPDENWEKAGLPLINPNSPYARAEGPTTEELQKQVEELKTQLAEKETPKVKKEVAKVKAKPKGMSDEAKQRMRDMMNKRWADKKAAKQPPAAV